MSDSLEDWLGWTDARGGTLEEAGFREWLSELIRKEREEAWDEGVSQGVRAHCEQDCPVEYDKRFNPYRKEQP